MKKFISLIAFVIFNNFLFANYLDRDEVQDFIDYMHEEHKFSKEYLSKTLSLAKKQQKIID